MAKDLATAYLYSAVPACLFGGLLSAWLGRRKMVLLALGYIALPLSPSFAWLVPARVFTALCAWLAYPSANVLVTEFVHPTVRGSLESFTSLFLAIEMLQSYALGYLLPWRTSLPSSFSACSSFQSHRNGWPCRGGGKRHLQACPGLEVQSS